MQKINSSSSSEQQKTGSKRKHVNLTIQNKLKVIEHLEKGMQGKVIAPMFGISRQTVSDIKKHASAIKAFAAQYEETKCNIELSKRMTLKRYKYDKDLEIALYSWYLRQRRDNVNVQASDLLAFAENLKRQFEITELNLDMSWLNYFRYRHNIKDSDVGINLSQTQKTESELLSENKPLKTNCSSSVEQEVAEAALEQQNEASVVMPMPMEFEIKEEGAIDLENCIPSSSEGNPDGQAVSRDGDDCGDDESSLRQNSALDEAREGIDAVINYIGFSTNRELWNYYGQLRTVRELIIEDQRKIQKKPSQGVEAQFQFPCD